MNKSRFEAFSDGVFAFAITLLILGIALPEVYSTNHDLTAGLVKLWPKVVAYALSFAAIGIMWHNHQALFRLVERVDRQTVFLNLALLACTAFVPFATSSLGSYPTMQAAAFVYGLTLLCCATANNLMLNHLVRARAFRERVHDARIAQTVYAYRLSWAIYFIAMLLALVAPVVSFAAYIAIVIYFLIPRGVDVDL